MTQVVYSDINPLYNGRNYKDLLINAEAVNAHIYSIITTQPGQLWWFPTYACDIESQLFEPMDEVTAEVIKTILTTALAEWEPRIYVYPDSEVIPDYDRNAYRVTIRYSMINQPYPWDVEFTGFLTRT